MHHFRRSNQSGLSVIVHRLIYELMFPRMWGVFVCLFSFVYVAHIAENAAVHLAVLKEFLKQIIKIFIWHYIFGSYHHLRKTIGFLESSFFILFFPVSPHYRQFPDSWCLSFVLFVKLSPSYFLLFWRYFLVLIVFTDF